MVLMIFIDIVEFVAVRIFISKVGCPDFDSYVFTCLIVGRVGIPLRCRHATVVKCRFILIEL